MMDDDGATLVEALAFTVIAIIFVISAVALWNMASNSANAQNVIRQYQGMAQDIQDLFQGQDNYSGIGPDLLVDSEVLPEDLRIDESATTAAINNTYGGQVTFGTAASLSAATGANEQRFTITYDNVPQEACINITSTLAGTFNQVDVNGTVWDDDQNGARSSNETDGLPLTTANAQSACGSATNSITYYSR